MNIKIRNWYYEVEIQFAPTKDPWTKYEILDCPGSPCTVGRHEIMIKSGNSYIVDPFTEL